MLSATVFLEMSTDFPETIKKQTKSIMKLQNFLQTTDIFLKLELPGTRLPRIILSQETERERSRLSRMQFITTDVQRTRWPLEQIITLRQ